MEKPEKKFWDVSSGSVVALSPFTCIAPFGETVYAETRSAAQELYFRYRNGEKSLKRDLWLPGEDTPYSGVIFENATFVPKEKEKRDV